jgi:hypothetical protein
VPRRKLEFPNYRLRDRNGVWYVDWTDLATGRTRARSTKKRDRAAAEMFLYRFRYTKRTEPHIWKPLLRDVNRCKEIARGLYYRARDRATAGNFECELSVEIVNEMLLATGGRCQVSGTMLDLSKPIPGARGRRPWAPSMDRKDHRIGYTIANSRIVCCAANFAMNMWGDGILADLLESYHRAVEEGFFALPPTVEIPVRLTRDIYAMTAGRGDG